MMSFGPTARRIAAVSHSGPTEHWTTSKPASISLFVNLADCNHGRLLDLSFRANKERDLVTSIVTPLTAAGYNDVMPIATEFDRNAHELQLAIHALANKTIPSDVIYGS